MLCGISTFFRNFYQPFCLHPDMSILQTISLDYAVAVYPLMLISITYCLVRLHDRYIVFSRLWFPVYRCCSTFRRKWNIRESLVNAFATFLILSYVKIMNVSFDLLTYNASLHDEHGHHSGLAYLFINGSMIPFSKEHTPYAILAIMISFIFNFLPLVLLCVYPSRCFQKCLNCTKCQYQTLHVFMDTFQGCYKETPRDCRYFAGFYLFLRGSNLLLFSVTNSLLYYPLMIYIIIIPLILVAICRPYKNSRRNNIDIVIFVLAISVYVAALLLFESPFVNPKQASHLVRVNHSYIIVILFILPLYGLFLLIYRLYSLLKVGMTECGCLEVKRSLLSLMRDEDAFVEDVPSLPVHRTTECSPLLK